MNSPSAVHEHIHDHTPQGRKQAGPGRLAAASMIGTTLEWYDFTVYNMLAALIFSQVFFPSFDPMLGTVLAFSTYAVGFISRPIGGFIFGHMGDKLGRRHVLVVTLVLMGLTTGLIGFLPTYASWGILSPVLLVTLRFIQGIALGGEWAGAVLIAVEHGAPDKRGRNASWTQVGPACGTLLATAAISLITYVLAPDTFLAWGWRVPFIASTLLVMFGLWIRSGVAETPMFEALEKSQLKAKTPLLEVLRDHWRRVLIAGGVRIGSDVLYGLVVVFSLTYVTTVLHLSRSMALTALMVGTVVNALAVPMFGALSDRIGRRPVYAAGALLGLAWAWVFFSLLDTRQTASIFLAIIVGLLIHAIMYGPQAAFVIEQFPTRVRYAGSSLAYTLSGIVGGGFAPLIFAALYKGYASTAAISVYVMVALAATGLALLAARETGKSPLQ